MGSERSERGGAAPGSEALSEAKRATAREPLGDGE